MRLFAHLLVCGHAGLHFNSTKPKTSYHMMAVRRHWKSSWKRGAQRSSALICLSMLQMSKESIEFTTMFKTLQGLCIQTHLFHKPCNQACVDTYDMMRPCAQQWLVEADLLFVSLSQSVNEMFWFHSCRCRCSRCSSHAQHLQDKIRPLSFEDLVCHTGSM